MTRDELKKAVKDRLKKEEGKRLKPYRDTEGFLTIGYGRNLDGKGITDEEADYLLDNDVNTVIEQLAENISFYSTSPDQVKIVLTDMAFNLGYYGLMKFQHFLAYLDEGKYKEAAGEMLNSKWATQVKGRATELSNLLKTI